LYDTGFGTFVNVDTNSEYGIKQSRELGLIPSNLVDLIISNRAFSSLQLFNSKQRPRMFTMIRHPFHRIHSLFHYQKYASHEKKYHLWSKSRKTRTFLDFLRNCKENQNFMVATLTNTPNRKLGPDHVRMATKILSEKCLVGITEQFHTSIKRFQQYFGWHNDDHSCTEKFVNFPINKNNHKNYTKLIGGSREWNFLVQTMNYDLQLYKNAIKIFESQSKMFS